MKNSKHRHSLGGAAAVSALAATTAVVLVRRARRRWAVADDPTGGSPLDDLAGLNVRVHQIDAPGGARLHVVEAGGATQATTFVLAHCWTGDRRVWGPVARRLVEAGHRVVAYDHRGHGLSSAGDNTLSLEILAEDLGVVLEKLDIRDAVLAGHSMGGMTIQALSQLRSGLPTERVRSVVLVATASAALVDPVQARLGPVLLRHRRAERSMSGASGALGARLFVGASPCASHIEAMSQTFVATPGHVRADMLSSIANMDVRRGLAQIDMPVTIVVGSRDLATPPRHARRMAETAPNARLVVIEGAGHMLPFEAPDRLTEILLEAASSVLSERTA